MQVLEYLNFAENHKIPNPRGFSISALALAPQLQMMSLCPDPRVAGSNSAPAVLSPKKLSAIIWEVKPMITELVKRQPSEDPEASGWEAHVHI